MATHSSILAWKTLWTEEPGRLQSIGSQKSWTRLSNFTSVDRDNKEWSWLISSEHMEGSRHFTILRFYIPFHVTVAPALFKSSF